MSTVTTTRIQYTPSPFARASLLHLAEVGSLTALEPHTSKRANLGGLLLLLVEKGSGEVVAAGKKHRLTKGDVAFIDCSQPYSHSTGDDLWTIHWAHFDCLFTANSLPEREDRLSMPRILLHILSYLVSFLRLLQEPPMYVI